MRRIVAFVAMLAATCAVAQGAPLPAAIGPYLQNPGPDAMTVCYLTQGQSHVEVLFGRERPDRRAPASASLIAGTPWVVWKARLTGLTPGALYHYQVFRSSGDAVTREPELSFTVGDPRARQVRLIALNDLHNRVETLQALMAQVKPEDFGMSLLLGDCFADPSAANGAEGVFRTLDATIRLLDAGRKPMLVVRGNHETRGGFAGRLEQLFDIPGLDGAVRPEERAWAFTLRAGPAYFVAADTGEDDDFTTDEKSYKRPKFWQDYRRREAPWIRNALAPARVGDARWKVFLSHIPLYNPAGWDSEPSRLYWEPILKAAGVDLMLAGHDHGWKLVPAGQAIPLKPRAAGAPGTVTPPCPVVIGGGPSLAEATVMLIEATPEDVRVRMLNTAGKLLVEAHPAPK